MSDDSLTYHVDPPSTSHWNWVTEWPAWKCGWLEIKNTFLSIVKTDFFLFKNLQFIKNIKILFNLNLNFVGKLIKSEHEILIK